MAKFVIYTELNKFESVLDCYIPDNVFLLHTFKHSNLKLLMNFRCFEFLIIILT